MTVCKINIKMYCTKRQCYLSIYMRKHALFLPFYFVKYLICSKKIMYTYINTPGFDICILLTKH